MKTVDYDKEQNWFGSGHDENSTIEATYGPKYCDLPAPGRVVYFSLAHPFFTVEFFSNFLILTSDSDTRAKCTPSNSEPKYCKTFFP